MEDIVDVVYVLNNWYFYYIFFIIGLKYYMMYKRNFMIMRDIIRNFNSKHGFYLML